MPKYEFIYSYPVWEDTRVIVELDMPLEEAEKYIAENVKELIDKAKDVCISHDTYVEGVEPLLEIEEV